LFSRQIRLKTAKLKISSLRLFFDVLSAYLGFINEYCASLLIKGRECKTFPGSGDSKIRPLRR
jgi:hypothetical protein